ncbi:hypothetical protein Tco_1265798 [Tanacetum coccineum]
MTQKGRGTWWNKEMKAKIVEVALHSRIQRFEDKLMDLEPRVQALLEVLPKVVKTRMLKEPIGLQFLLRSRVRSDEGEA